MKINEMINLPSICPEMASARGFKIKNSNSKKNKY